MGEITLVTDFFDIGRGQDKNKELARTSQKYMNEFRRWARIENKLIVYTDSKSAEQVMDIRREFGREKQTIIVPVDNLFELEGSLFARMQKNAKNPKFLNFRYLPEAFSNNPKYNYLWMMKYYFMNDAYNRGLLSEQVVWIDFGFDHGGVVYLDTEDFNFKWEYDFGEKIHIFCLSDPNEMAGIECLQYQPDCVQGSMYGLPSKLAPVYWEMIRKAMEALLMLDCVDDDQLLVLMAYKARPDLFEVHVNNWNLGMKLCGAGHMKSREFAPGKPENKYKRAIRLAIRKIIPNRKDPKRLYAKRCYNTAVRIYGK